MRLNKTNRTIIPERDKIERKWWLVDADGVILGRLASKVANILKGKVKPSYTPFLDTGDFVVVINAKKIKISGNKDEDKVYYRHSGYMGGIRETSYKKLLNLKPEKIILMAVKRMLAKNKLNNKVIKKLKIYPGPDHKHQAQKPEALKI